MVTFRTVNVLHSVPFQGLSLGTHHKHCSYILGYMFPNDALYATRHITKNVKVDLLSYEPTLTSRVVDTEEGRQVLLMLENPTPVVISKEFSPEFEWYTEELDASQFFSIPLVHNLGLILPFEKINETNEDMTFQSYIVDPINDVMMFRSSLNI